MQMDNNTKSKIIPLCTILIIVPIAMIILYMVTSEMVRNGNIPNASDEQQVKQENSEFFDKYLYSFLPMASANNFKKTITDFTDEDITNFVYFYVFNNRKELSGNKEE